MVYQSVQSSMLDAVRYDDESSTLGLRFNNGKIYEYPNVPRHVYSAFLAAPSKGQFFDANVKGKYASRKIN